MVTMSDIAKMAGVSQPTVSRVLNGKGAKARISPATQKRIKEIARELQFRPSFAGQALVSGRTKSIGFICGNIRNPYYTEMADIAMQAVEERGYHLLMGVARWVTWQNDLECFDSLLARGVDGVIYFGSALAPGRTQYEQVLREHYPLVSVNYRFPRIPSILSDAQPGMNEAFALLKANGHSRVLGVWLVQEEKHHPFVKAAKEFGFDAEFTTKFKSGSANRPDQSLQNMRREAHCFAERMDRPSAVFVTSDQYAAAFIGGLWDKGILVPRDVSVFAYDGTRAGEYMTPPLTSIRQDLPEMIHKALEIIFDRIDGKNTFDSDTTITLPTRLIVRESIGPAVDRRTGG
ncbi:MAG: LacI family DNA-binding transcriptional regulator [Phycisphaerae bacterium]|nr:LacI family DNA-binding transcriptional regulator [Phycisphaerae bacterium]